MMRDLSEVEAISTFPTSIGQKRCWFMEQIHPGNRGLNLAVRWELRGPATSEMVQSAFNRIIARHEILRTRFAELDGEPVQEVVDHVDFKLDLVDVRTLDKKSCADRITAIAIEHAEQPFDLGTACLLRVVMIRKSTDRAELLIAVHNAVFDGYSIGVLGHELGQILDASIRGVEPELPDLCLQYGDYAQWLQDYENSGALAEEEAYWTETLRGAPYFELPADRSRTAGEVKTAACIRALPADFEDRLAVAAKSLGTSVFALGTAAFSAALGLYSGTRDLSFAVQVAGRMDVDLEPLIGIFTNPLVLRFDVDETATLGRHAEATRDIVNGALAHQMLPFDKLVQVINPVRDPLRIPLVSIMFNLQKAFLKEGSYGDIELVSVPSHSPATLYDLSVNIVGRNAGWRLMIDYNSNLFDAASIEVFSNLLVDVFARITEAPDTRLSDIPARGEAVLLSSDHRVVEPEAVTPIATKSGGAFDGHEDLRALWAELLVLPPEQIMADGNFFDLGGHSVLALRMLARVGQIFGTRPSLYAFLNAPTLCGLGELLQPEKKPAQAKRTKPLAPSGIWDLIELRSGSDLAPVLLTVNQPFMYHALAREMGVDCTVANLGVPDKAALSRLRESGFDPAIAAATQVVRARYGDRPLLLCGLCVDGRVALRLAQTLQADGSQVASVAMIDTWAPGAVKAFSGMALMRDRWRIRLRRLRYYLGLRARGDIMWRDVFSQNSFVAGTLRRLGLLAKRGDVEVLVDATVDCLVSQTRRYSFKPYDGEVALFVTSSQGLVPHDGVLGWSGKLARDVAVYPVNGWHGDALTRSGFDRVFGVLEEKVKRLSAQRSR